MGVPPPIPSVPPSTPSNPLAMLPGPPHLGSPTHRSGRRPTRNEEPLLKTCQAALAAAAPTLAAPTLAVLALAAFALSLPSRVAAQEPVIEPVQEPVLGLLTLPEVFGVWACDDFVPGEVPLYGAPGSPEATATIRVDRGWTFHDVGGCEGLEVRVHPAGGAPPQELPTTEHAYEAPAAIVLDARDGWLRIRTEEGGAWLKASTASEFFPLEELLMDALAFVTEHAEGPLLPSSGATTPDPGSPALVPGTELRVLGSEWVGGELRLHVELLSHSPCLFPPEPTVVGAGWVRAHGVGGEPAVWFFSRGC